MRRRSRRAIGDPPTKKHHLNDKVVNIQQDLLANQVIKIAVLTQPPPNANLGGAFSNTLAISQTNVQRADTNGGGNVNKPLLEQPRTSIISTGDLSNAALRRMIETLQQVERNCQMHDTSNDESDAPKIIDNNITMITNQKQLDKSREERNRKKARTLSVKETNQRIGIETIEYPVSDDEDSNSSW